MFYTLRSAQILTTDYFWINSAINFLCEKEVGLTSANTWKVKVSTDTSSLLFTLLNNVLALNLSTTVTDRSQGTIDSVRHIWFFGKKREE